MAASQQAEIPLTRCPKCGGLKRGKCTNCRGARREAVGNKIFNLIMAFVAMCAIGLVSIFVSPFWGGVALAGLILYLIIVAAVRAGRA